MGGIFSGFQGCGSLEDADVLSARTAASIARPDAGPGFERNRGSSRPARLAEPAFAQFPIWPLVCSLVPGVPRPAEDMARLNKPGSVPGREMQEQGVGLLLFHQGLAAE